jgi:gas vesicle protein
MSDPTETRTSSNGVPVMLGFAIGAVVGAGLALLLAPASGKQTRERLAEGVRRSGQLGEDALEVARSAAGDALEQARSAAEDLGKDVLTAVQAGRDSYTHDRSAR